MTDPERRPKTIDECWFRCRCKECGMIMCAASFEENHKGPGKEWGWEGHSFLNECFIALSDKRCHYGFE